MSEEKLPFAPSKNPETVGGFVKAFANMVLNKMVEAYVIYLIVPDKRKVLKVWMEEKWVKENSAFLGKHGFPGVDLVFLKRPSEFTDQQIKKLAKNHIIVGKLPVSMMAKVCAQGALYFDLDLTVPPYARCRKLTMEDLEKSEIKLTPYNVKDLSADE
jgi:putative CRISPR-associated protein (TIGR02620 family)